MFYKYMKNNEKRHQQKERIGDNNGFNTSRCHKAF